MPTVHHATTMHLAAAGPGQLQLQGTDHHTQTTIHLTVDLNTIQQLAALWQHTTETEHILWHFHSHTPAPCPHCHC